MNKKITVKGIHEHEAERSQSIRNYIDDNLKKLEQLLAHYSEAVSIDVTVDIHRTHAHHICDLRIHGPNHLQVIVKKEGPEVYKVIDAVIHVATQDVIKHKERNMKNN